MRKLTESMETVLEYIATGIAPVDMARMGSQYYALSFQGLERRGLVQSSPNGGKLTDAGRSYWAEKSGAPVPPVVESGDKVARGSLKGRVLEVTVRAGVMLAAVAFGFEMVWVKVTELIAL